MTIHLYAEHLVNIRTLSIQASLSTCTNKETNATLSADGRVLSLSHEGETASITLPINVSEGHSAATLTIPAAPTKDLTFRVSLSEKAGSDLLTTGSLEDTNTVPWTARSLTPDTELRCKICDSTILPRGRVRVWKDLPSENWAEMMDFWHCHRPDVPHEHQHDHAAPLKKGYSADSRLVLEPGVGMVDFVDFVFAADDCQNIETLSLEHSSSEDQSLQCKNCQTILGHVHAGSEGYKLRKSHLSLSSSDNFPHLSYSADKWLACHLLASVESQGVRKFAIQSSHSGKDAIKVWIFTPDTTISSSAAATAEPIRAIKVLWVDCEASRTQDGSLNRQALSEGELELPKDEFDQLRSILSTSAALLPQNARTFQSWQVALLPRFIRADIEPDVNHPATSLAGPITLPEVPDLQNKEILSDLTS